jgi:polyhydroxybutyrate depolymerase
MARGSYTTLRQHSEELHSSCARYRLVASAVIALLAILPASAHAAQPSPGCVKALLNTRFMTRIPIDGVNRTALVNLPPGRRPPATPLPLVMMFHGAGSEARGTEASTGVTTAANRYGFIAVYPNANGKYWNLGGSGATGEDDVDFVGALLDHLESNLCVDESRVYATGGSNGGGFVTRVGCELSDRFAAIAPVAGLYGLEPPCNPKRAISVLEIHGTADQTVPYDGWGPGGKGSVWSFLTQWDQLDSCPSAPAAWSRLGRGALLEVKSSCANGTTVAHIKLIGEPHAWPSTAWWIAHRRSEGVPFEASMAVMRFFATGQAPGAAATGKR